MNQAGSSLQQATLEEPAQIPLCTHKHAGCWAHAQHYYTLKNHLELAKSGKPSQNLWNGERGCDSPWKHQNGYQTPSWSNKQAQVSVP